jgi:Raf kinase inhibitor-like YbhB/YbcL family protein
MRHLNLLTVVVCLFFSTGYAQQEKTTQAEKMNQKNDSIRTVNISNETALLSLQKINPRATLTVTSTAFTANQTIPETYSDLGEKISPPLQWTAPPDTTKSLVILMEDPDAPKPKPFIHWVLYDLPPTLTSLRIGVPNNHQLPDFDNARQGINSRGSIGYFGPHPPPQDKAHHYHFQIFALDKRLDLLPGKSQDEVFAAMKDHVVAAGELVGEYAQKNEAKP